MTRPGIVRADTLDLQDHDTPSAKDHSRQPSHPPALGEGPAAPHQNASLRHVYEERIAENEHLQEWGSGRSSHEGSDLLREEPRSSQEGVNGEDQDMRMDDAAVQQNGGDDSNMGDIDGDDNLDDDLLDDKISSSPSIDDEDIDFEFVYALHTFVATVEGQANATKGDTMVLLDDTNTYWWLVRVVKDSSIGYLPAEHIETPTERLARLNKHRNIDLSATMLGDNPEKSKNPLKKAIRRRNAKMVQFTTPTYYEAPETDWSDLEGEADGEAPNGLSLDGGNGQAGELGVNEDESTGQRANDDTAEEKGVSSLDSALNADQPSSEDDIKGASELSTEETTEPVEGTGRRSKNGTIRNTDSFFKDDTAEPRKISLTPNLLREETSQDSSRSSDSKDKAPSTHDIFEQIDAEKTEKPKDERKKKDKKPGMLSGLFKRKDKKLRVDEAAGGSSVTARNDDAPSSPLLSPDATSSFNAPESPTTQTAPTRAGSKGKLTKPPPPGLGAPKSPTSPVEASQAPPSTTVPAAANPAASVDLTTPQPPYANSLSKSANDSKELLEAAQPAPKKGGLSSLWSSKEPREPAEPKREKLKKAKERMDLDVESSPETEKPPPGALSSGVVADEQQTQAAPERPAPQPPTGASNVTNAKTLQVSKPQLALETRTGDAHETYASYSGETTRERGNSTDISTPSGANGSETVVTPTASSPTSMLTAKTPPQPEGSEYQWDDASLRDYLDKNEARDLLLLIHDNTGVTPLPRDHPTMIELGFHEQQKKLNEMNAQLDGMLNGLLARRASKPKVPRP